MADYTIYPSLRGKTVVITGGAEGIGAAAVELFYLQGSKVIIFDRADEIAKKLISEITDKHSKTAQESWRPKAIEPAFYHCDVTELDKLMALAKQVLDEHGPVHVLLNNAAAAGAKSRVPSTEITPEIWETDVNVNLRHIMFLTQAIIPSMQKLGAGSVINMGSITWRIPATGLAVYTMCAIFRDHHVHSC
jgi:NAD(P)-dependent dehydrogenase (short-subunit alcohol dehydrogenase family)